MNLPKIDLTAIPGLETAQGLYGSITQGSGPYGDAIIGIMVYVYDTEPPPGIMG